MIQKVLSFIVENIYNFFDIFHSWRLKNFYKKKDFDLVIDVGSHKGEFINRVINKKIPVYSFEPQIEVRKFLKKNTSQRNILEYYEYAVSNYEGSIDLYINNMSSTTTTKKTRSSSNWLKFKNFILGGKSYSKIDRVKVITLDNLLFDKLGSKKILLKIDVEGGEAEVLQGSENILKKCNVVFIQLESAKHKIYKNSFNPEKFLLESGFRIEKKFLFPLLNFEDIVYIKN